MKCPICGDDIKIENKKLKTHSRDTALDGRSISQALLVKRDLKTCPASGQTMEASHILMAENPYGTKEIAAVRKKASLKWLAETNEKGK